MGEGDCEMRNLLLCGICMVAVTVALAQSPGTGAIAGRITDLTGAVLTRTTVLAVDQATQMSRSAVSSEQGEFRISLLPPGSYSLSASASGFETTVINHISVVAGETATLELKLSVGRAKDTVEVTGATDLAQTETSTLGRVIDEAAIESLPLANRNYTQLIALSPGVVVELPNAVSVGKKR